MNFIRCWIEALLSGKYQQGQNTLRNGDKYCCLGVVLDIIDPDGWFETTPGKWWHRLGRNSGATDPDEESGQDFLGAKALGILELTNSFQRSLAEMNDEKKLTFVEIADVIEKHLAVDEEVEDDGEPA